MNTLPAKIIGSISLYSLRVQIINLAKSLE